LRADAAGVRRGADVVGYRLAIVYILPIHRPVPVANPSLSFPPLLDIDSGSGHRGWPRLPVRWRHVEPPAVELAQPCRVETVDGERIDGELLAFDLAGQRLAWRRAGDGQRQAMHFGRCRRLTLRLPLTALDATQSRRQSLLGAVRPMEHADHPLATPAPLAEHERHYALAGHDGAPVLEGHTVGHVEVPEGLFLFEPVDEDMGLQRVFAPRAANAGVELGRTALELATQDWAATPDELLQRVETVHERPVPPLGVAAVSLGLLTPAQVRRCVAEVTETRPLGQVLLGRRLLSQAQLQAVIAHKMGCAVVDLARFAIEPKALTRLPQRVAWSQRVLPLCIAGERLHVASDLAIGAEKARLIQSYTGLPVVPALARTPALSQLLRDLPAEAWAQGR
jgi:hypothetical protein